MFDLPETELRIKATEDEVEDPNRYDPVRSEERLRALTEKLQRQERMIKIVRNAAILMKSWLRSFKKKNVARAP